MERLDPAHHRNLRPGLPSLPPVHRLVPQVSPVERLFETGYRVELGPYPFALQPELRLQAQVAVMAACLAPL